MLLALFEVIGSQCYFLNIGPLETCYPNVMIDVHSPELANEIKQKIQGEV